PGAAVGPGPVRRLGAGPGRGSAGRRRQPQRPGAARGAAPPGARRPGPPAGTAPRGARAALPGAAIDARGRRRAGRLGRGRQGSPSPRLAEPSGAARRGPAGGRGMTGPADLPGATDAVLADLVEEVARRLQAGDRVTAEAYAAAHPALAAQLRQLWPT